ncbi:hypothetical protein RDV89_18805 [Nocardioides zeae]|uniref:Uncharacterized protein n=1 Tax=Nocardioides imazamoxiresistens TaxID=3231893 RepID=A0ABU3Q0W2_9ACTN|nr:hypothetical protein [Nocardioides zeae]MDT9595145.1 hypothetical protein [Nocardioides zeae]
MPVLRPLLALALLAAGAVTGVTGPAGPAGAQEAAGGALGLPTDVTRVAGTDPGAPTTLPAGWSRTELPGSAGSRYFSYTRAVAGSGVLVTAAGPGADATSAEAFRIEITTTDGTTCSSQSASRSEGDLGLVVATTTAGDVDPETETETDASCREAESLRITLSRSSSVETATDSDVWFRVVEEAPVDDVSDLPPAEERASVGPVDVGGEAQDEQGGTDVSTAPLVDTGIWRGTVPADGQTAYRVRLDFGQTLYAEAVSPAVDAELAADLGYDTRLRAEVLSPQLSSATTSSSGDNLGTDPASARAAAGPVQYLNRYEVSPAPSRPGEFVVVVSLDAGEDVDLDEVPYTLRLRVDGDAAAAPAYASTPPFVIAEGERADGIELGVPGAEDEAGRSVVRTVAGAGLVAGGLAALLAGVVLLRRQTSR